MKRTFATLSSILVLLATTLAQNPQRPSQPPQEEDIIRISTALVQTDVVVVDKNEKIVPDLSLEDFEVFENGKKQDVKFMEFVGVDTGHRSEGDRPAGLPSTAELPRDVTGGELKRVIAFVVDDLTIPFEDMARVRKVLSDFVDTQMLDGDLVAIVRVVGGKGLLQQFTSDKQLLRRAIATLNVATSPYSAFNNPPQDKITGKPQLLPGTSTEGVSAGGEDASFEDQGLLDPNDPNNENLRLQRGLFSIATANFVIDSLKEVPGRKSLVLISGGIPIFETNSTGTTYSTVSYLLNQLTDNAIRAGVVINALDPRGLKASSAVRSFTETPGRSALGNTPDPNFGRGGSSAGRADITPTGGDISSGSGDPFTAPLSGASEHLGLETVANATGGISVVNSDNFKAGLDKVLARSNGYYVLAYRPAEKFDDKFRKIQIRVKREGVKVYSARGYVARKESPSNAARTKEESILSAAKSPLAKRGLDVSANIMLKPSATNNRTTVGIEMLIDANKLNFTQGTDGRYQTSFDVVGFVYDQMGKLRGGFSETVNTNLTPEKYTEALKTGLSYSASTELPPGYFQIRAAVREAATGSLGTTSRYLEIPNLSNGRLTMSSLFIFAADPARPKEMPQPLLALRQISRKQDLRYAAQIFNAKTSGGKGQLRTQMIVSQGANILFREPEQTLETPTNAPVTKIGQLALSKVSAGRYVLTLVVTDPQADKKSQTIARSVDFTVVN